MFLPAFRNYRFFTSLFVLALVLLTASRLVFAMTNPDTLQDTGSTTILLIFLQGLRYDIAATSWLLLPLLLIYLYPLEYSLRQPVKTFSAIVFAAIVSVALLANFADAGWYAFQKRRSTMDVFRVLLTGDDLTTNLPAYLADYWYLLAAWICSIWLIFRGSLKQAQRDEKLFHVSPVFRIFTALVFAAIYFVAIRGGIQLKPLSTQAAAIVNGPSSAPLVLNTPYTILKSVERVSLKEANYYSREEAEKLFPLHFSMQRDSVQHPNIIILILESFSKEYTGLKNGNTSYTPFLDSLAKISLNFTDAYANGKRSIEGLPAILSSIPALTDEPFITSQYNTNKISSVAGLLRKTGYSSAFFHGGSNGTMGFDNFTAAAGYEKYYGRSQYDGDRTDDDGNWGIYDHAFYRFMIRKLKTQPRPFTVTFFSLSSHHPYVVPDDRKNKYADGPLPILKSIRYADDALREFFTLAAAEPWFANTVFILTADHTGPSLKSQPDSPAAMFEIPLLIYRQGITAKTVTSVAQQIDILPTALHLGGFNGNYKSAGRNLFDPARFPFAVNYHAGNWQLVTDSTLVVWNEENSPSCTSRIHTVIPDQKCKNDQAVLKALLQQYRHALITNTLQAE